MDRKYFYPLAPEAKAEVITFAVPCNTPVSRVVAQTTWPTVRSGVRRTLTWRFDETDAMVMFDNVMGCRGERVFVHDDPALSRALLYREWRAFLR